MNDADVLSMEAEELRAALAQLPAGPGFTADRIAQIILGAAEMLEAELRLGERDTDLLSLLIAAVGVRLSVPDAGLDTVVRRALPGRTPEEVRGWWIGWS